MGTASQPIDLPPVVAEPIDHHQVWLDERRQHVGGSDSASLFPEDSKYGCPTRLWFDKNNRPADYPRTDQDAKVLKRGQIWEDIVALYFSEHTGMKVRRMGQRVSKAHPTMAINMDRQIVAVSTDELKAAFPDSAEIQAMEGDCGPGYLECKTANPFVYAKMMKPAAEGGGVPNDYILQVNHGLMVTGYKWGVFAVLDPSFGNFAAFPHVFKPNLGAEQIKRSEHFFSFTILQDKPPMPTVLDERCKGCLWRKSCPRYEELLGINTSSDGFVEDDSLAELVLDYRAARKAVEEKEATVENIKATIQVVLAGREKVLVPSVEGKIQWTQNKPPQRWDSKALEGTVSDLKHYELPEDAICGFAGCNQPVKGIISCPYRILYRHDFGEEASRKDHHLHYVCDLHAVKGVKDGGRLVGRAGVSALVLNCKRAGEPSRPFICK